MPASPRLVLLLLLAACRSDPAPKGSGDSGTAPGCDPVSAATVRVEGSVLVLEDPDCGGLALSPRVLGQGELRLSWARVPGGGLQPTLTATEDAVFTGLVLEGSWWTAGEADPVLWKQGYQSWSWSGVTAPGAATRDADGVVLPGGDGDATSVIGENAATSWWVGLLGRADGASVVLGAQGATETRFFVGLDGDTVQAVWGHRGEAVALSAGETLALDPLWVATGADPSALLEAYAEAVATRVPPRPLATPPPTGWATWYQYYSDVHEDDVRANLDALVALGAPVDVFQVDDGWQVRWGDWWAGEDFPSGMGPLAADIEAAGFTPGLWLAPFYVSVDSETYTEHPDWWVRDGVGEPIRFTNLGTGDYAIVDVTHPEAAAWLEAMLAGIRAQGWAYLKLDFLYAGAQEGQRREAVTGIQAYQRGLAILRRAAGDAWILGCGAPLLPSVGFAESMRTGADIAFEVSPDPAVAYYRWQARSTGARLFSHGRWWWLDPDQLIVRDPLGETEVRGAVASGVAAGGTWMLGDDLGALPEDRLDALLDPALLDLLGQTARPFDPLSRVSGVDPSPVVEAAQGDDQPPARFDLADGTVVLLNLGGAPLDVDGPGGTDLLSGAVGPAGPRTLAPGAGEVWVP